MNKHANMTKMSGSKEHMDDEIIYTLEDDGEIQGHDYRSYQEWRQDKETVGIDAHWIPVAIVDHIKQEGVDEIPKDRADITVGDMRALAFMHDNMGELYCEVLRSYTHFIQDGMRVETAVYAAMLAWDLEIPGVEA